MYSGHLSFGHLILILVPFSNVSLFTLSQHEPSHLVLSKAISTSIKLSHRFSDLYSFHKSYSSQVSNYLTFRYISQMYQGVFTQCCGVAHNSTFSDLPQSVESFLFTFNICTYGALFSSQFSCNMGHFTIPYICCFVRGTYHPIHLQWGIHSSHSWLLFVAHYISHH